MKEILFTAGCHWDSHSKAVSRCFMSYFVLPIPFLTLNVSFGGFITSVGAESCLSDVDYSLFCSKEFPLPLGA